MLQRTEPRPLRRGRVPTISDIRVKTCWICLEEETAGDPNASGDWCHPCKCTLVCHGKCLLQWITAQEESTARTAGAVKCPQCATEYTVVSYQPTLLRTFDTVHTRLVLFGALWAVTGVVVTATGTILILGCAYGSEAFSAFIGQRPYELLVDNDPTQWPLWLWFDFLAIPWTLYTAGYNRSVLFNLSSVIGAFPLSVVGMRGTDESIFTFPPSPFISLAMLPFFIAARNFLYERLQKWVTQKAAKPIHDKSYHIESVPGTREVAFDFRLFRRRRQAPRDEAAAPDVAQPQRVQVVRQGQVEARGAAPVGDNINRVLRGSRIGTTIVRPLLLPWIAKWMGSLLLRISDYLPFLQPVLGLQKHRYPMIRYKGTISVGLGTSWTWRDLDPVWWRNTLGLATFGLCFDGFQLWYTYLIERERQSRCIVSQSFEGIDISSLDLISEV
ncbi:hypothetical protein FRC15_002752 [Serendipita sp. 397]|nr:hypothetical protein FRC15_002752 [Serendipita sp. 397]